MDQAIKAGIIGFIIALIIYTITPIDLYFLPEFVASIIAIYFYGLKTIKDCLLTAFMTYIFTEGIAGAINLALYYYTINQSINLTIDLWLILSQLVIPLTALVAGYVGFWLVQKRPRVTAPAPPPPIPPV